MRPEDWRRRHPDWDGRFFFRSGIYFYDPYFAYPAVVDNDWYDIATISGGVALLSALQDDPTLFFIGTAGAFYSLDRYNEDLHSGDREFRLRAAYFSRPYFWRDGSRYDRIRVDNDGRQFYRFVRH